MPVEDRRLLERILAAPPGARGLLEAEEVSLRDVDRFWPQRRFDDGGYSVELRCLEDELDLTAGREQLVDVAVRNGGTETLPWGGGPPGVRAAYHWLSPDGEMVVFDGHRTPLPSDVEPGGEAIVPVHVVPPSKPGSYQLELDLVHEGVRWFERTTRVPARVAPPARSVRIPPAALDVASRVICVTGMHRSGTSLVTRILNLLGVYLGEAGELVPASADNPAGFWERKDAVAVNDELLALAGGAAISPPVLVTGWEDSLAFDPVRERAVGLMSGWLDGQPLVGWKDPRNSLTLPFWRTVVPVERTVLAVRHPLEVALSLERRNGIDEASASRLYVTYVVSALRNDPDCVVVRYADLFDDLDAAVGGLAAELGLDVPTSARAEIGAVVDSGLRNARFEHLPGKGPSAIAVRVYERVADGDRDAILRVADELLGWASTR